MESIKVMATEAPDTTSHTDLSVVQMTPAHVEQVVRVHLKAFRGFFLSVLGPRFLTVLYQEILQAPSGIAFVCLSGGVLRGFVAGTDAPLDFYRRLLHRRWWRFGSAAFLPILKRPHLIPRLLNAFQRPAQALSHAEGCELMSIAVDPDLQGGGIARQLVNAFAVETAKRRRKFIVLTTDEADNQHANDFYLKQGFRQTGVVISPQGRRMSEYKLMLDEHQFIPTSASGHTLAAAIFETAGKQMEDSIVASTKIVVQSSEVASVRPCASRGAVFARFMELRRFRVVEGCGALWYATGGGFFTSLPLHLRLEPSPDEVEEFLVKSRAVGARFSSTTWPGVAGGIYVCRKRPYDIRTVHHGMRSKVHKGMNECSVRLVEPAELQRQGLRLNLDTMSRQCRYDSEFGNPRRWNRFVQAAYKCPGIEAVGAFVNDQLAAYAITCREDGWLHVLYKMSRLDLLPHCPNHALDFVIARDAMADLALDAVSLGWQSLLPIEGLHVYKERFGYECVTETFAYRIHPALAPLLTSGTAVQVANTVTRMMPRTETLKIVAEVMRRAHVSHSAPLPNHDIHVPCNS